MPVRFGVSLPIFAEPDRLVELAVVAEAAGWDGVFLWDHLTAGPGLADDVADPWVLLGAIAARTQRVTLGPLITPLARRRPWVVAREITTLDRLSGGRAILGVGLGWPDDDFSRFGDVTDPRERGDVLDEALDIVEALWTGEPVQYAGTHFQLDDVVFQPRPVRGRVPVWVAGEVGYRRPLRRAAHYDGLAPLKTDASGVVVNPTQQDIAEMLDVVRATRRSTGPFDVVAQGPLPEDLASYEAVGVTWWLVAPELAAGWVDALESVVVAGPPR